MARTLPTFAGLTVQGNKPPEDDSWKDPAFEPEGARFHEGQIPPLGLVNRLPAAPFEQNINIGGPGYTKETTQPFYQILNPQEQLDAENVWAPSIALGGFQLATMPPGATMNMPFAYQPEIEKNITRETTPYSALPRMISDASQDEAISKWDIAEFGFDAMDLGFPGVGTGVKMVLGPVLEPLVTAGKAIPAGDALQAFAMLPQRAKNLLKNTKVTDEKGEPIPVYHGTMDAFQEFDPGITDPTGLFGPGTYFTEDKHLAAQYAGMLGTYLNLPQVTDVGSVHKAYLDIQKPFDIDAQLDEDLLRKFIFDSGRETKTVLMDRVGSEQSRIRDHFNIMYDVDEASFLDSWINVPGHGLPEGTSYSGMSKRMADIHNYTGEELQTLRFQMDDTLKTDMENFLEDLPYNATDVDVEKMPWLEEFITGEGEGITDPRGWLGLLNENFEIRNMPMKGEFFPGYGEKWLEPFSEIVQYSYQPVFVPKYSSKIGIQQALDLNKKYLDLGSSQYDIVSYTDDVIPNEVQGFDSLLDMTKRAHEAHDRLVNFGALDDELVEKIFAKKLTMEDIDKIKEFQFQYIKDYLDVKAYMEWQHRDLESYKWKATARSAKTPMPNNHQLYEFISKTLEQTTGYHNSKTATNTIIGRNGFDGITHVGGRWAGGGKREHQVWIVFDPGIVTDPVTQKTGTKTTDQIIRPFATMEGPLGGTIPMEQLSPQQWASRGGMIK